MRRTSRKRPSGQRYRGSGSAVTAVLAALSVLAVSSGATSGLDRADSVVAGARQPGAHATQAPSPVLANQVGASSVINVDGSLPLQPRPRTLYAGTVPSGPHGIPTTALRAYHNAAESLGGSRPACHIDWALISSVGRIESNHARGGYVDADGDTREPIRGPVLDGTGNVAAIPDTDDGRYDGNTTWDRAVGPMQFIPSTWQRYGADANGDGVADPDNIYDAALAAGRYLCAGGADLTDPEQLRDAVFRYNHSASYVEEVLAWAEAYRTDAKPVPDSDVPLAVPKSVDVAAAPAPVSPPPSTGGHAARADIVQQPGRAPGERSSTTATSSTSGATGPTTGTGSSASSTTPTSTSATTTMPSSTPTTTPTTPTPTSTPTSSTGTSTTTTTSCAPAEESPTTSSTTPSASESPESCTSETPSSTSTTSG